MKWVGALLVLRGIAAAAPASSADVVAIAAGTRVTCATHADGTVSCWGANDHGQLGDGSTTDSWVPIRMAGISDAVEVGTDDRRTCVRRKSGTIACFGLVSPINTKATTPVEIQAADATQIAGSCWRIADGTAACLTKSGQIQTLAGIGDAIDIAAKSELGCVARKTGAVACWISPSEVVAVRGVTGAVDVAVGERVACARTKAGAVTCWDWAIERLEPTKRPRPRPEPARQMPVVPRRVPDVVATALADGRDQMCAVTARDVRCWNERRRVTTTKLAGVKALAGDWHRCAWLGRRDVACWGPGSAGELGFGWGAGHPRPIALPGATDVVELAGSFNPSSIGQFTCARKKTGSITCWGDIQPNGQSSTSAAPREVFKRSARVLRSADPQILDDAGKWVLRHHTFRMPPVVDAQGDCAITKDARVLCTGQHRPSNDHLNDPKHPDGEGVEIAGITDATKLAVGGNFACALRRTGKLACFSQRTVVEEKLTDVVDVSTGVFAMCALRKDGTVWCMGQNGSWLLKGNPLQSSGDSDWTAIGLDKVASISAGYDHACARRIDGTVACVGNNDYGQLGDGTTKSRTKPAPVPGLANVVQVAAGTYHTCALLADATVKCWGDARSGAIGSYTTDEIVEPVRVTW